MSLWGKTIARRFVVSVISLCDPPIEECDLTFYTGLPETAQVSEIELLVQPAAASAAATARTPHVA